MCSVPSVRALALAAVLPWLTLRRAEAEERLDLKSLYYKEDGDRVRVFSQAAQFEAELWPSLTIKIEGVYDAISGATPTGAPPVPVAAAKAVPTVAPVVAPAPRPAPSEGESEGERGGDRRWLRIGKVGALQPLSSHLWAKAGATPVAAPAPAPAAPASAPAASAPAAATTNSAPVASSVSKSLPVPKGDTHDRRTALSLELDKVWGRHTLAAQFAYSTESDYWSHGLALRDAIDFNQKNTTLLLGVSANHDLVQGFYQPDSMVKNTYDGLLGLTQVLGAQTFITVNLTLGTSSGYLTDPYKIVELNGALVPEKRPDSRTRQVGFVALNHYIEEAGAGVEVSYRYYHDSFGIGAHTLTAAWYQKLGERFIVRPMARYYQQSAANFYAVQFAGAPDVYSADYRLSDFSALGVGLKLIWKPVSWLAFDVDGERYEQRGRDGLTSQDAYPAATIIMAGATLWF